MFVHKYIVPYHICMSMNILLTIKEGNYSMSFTPQQYHYFVSVWARILKNIPKIFHLCQLEYSLKNSNDMSKHSPNKIYIPTHHHKIHVIIIMWIHHMDIWWQYLCSNKCEYKIPPGFVPHVFNHKKVLVAFLKRSCPLELQRTHI
jgi:hypothetical protein